MRLVGALAVARTNLSTSWSCSSHRTSLTRPACLHPRAGTVACPTCHGSPKVHRITPDFAKALDMGALWDEQVAARMGRFFWGKDARPADKRRIYLEYPSGALQLRLGMLGCLHS